MKTFIYILISLFTVNTFAQVGFGTNDPDPAYSLTVQGDVKVEEINFESALPGMIYSSNGPSVDPSWKVIPIDNTSIPNLNFLLFSKSLNNYTTLSISSNQAVSNSNYSYSYNQIMNNNWKELPKNNQDTTFKVSSVNSKVFITMESVAQVSGSDGNARSGVNFACGIFVAESTTNSTTFGDYKLKGVRIITGNLGSNSHPFFNFTLSTEIKSEGNFTFNPSKNYDVKIGCMRRNSFGNYSGGLTIGGALESNINNFTAKTFLKINVFEPLN